MERKEAKQKLSELIGSDLRPLADKYGVTVWKEGKLNKGWVGHTIERHLGLPINSSRSPNFGSWELKQASLKKTIRGKIKVKETIAITMIDPIEISEKEFEESHLFRKMLKALVVARLFESKAEEKTILYSVSDFDLGDSQIFELVKQDYEKVREVIKTLGFHALTGKMGVLIQPRTKGPGHGSTSRAFYARTPFVAHIVGLEIHPLLIEQNKGE